MLVGCGVGDGVGVWLFAEHDKRSITKTKISRNIRVFTVKDIFIGLLLTDRVL